MTVQCRYARAAVASARAGLAHIRKQKPHGYLALFLALGLITNTRHVWHALTKRDRDEHRRVIDDWIKSPADWTKRLQPMLNTARDLLIKEWVSIPQVTTGSDDYYCMSMYIPHSGKQEAVMSVDEKQDREDAAMLAAAMGHDVTNFSKLVRIDLLDECERTLDLWDSELDLLEKRIAEASVL